MKPNLMCFTGEIIRGEGRGQQLGFPTANISLSGDVVKSLPKGVFAAFVRDDEDKEFHALANIGTKPTFGGTATTVELHILDFKGDLYGRKLSVALSKKLREERPFANPGELIAQINKDIQQARILFNDPNGSAQQLTTEVEGVDND
ncbi:MAG: hypothetical protein HN780_12275 [Gemmatimonadetes bacterium]|nr:hypothetical protein [Gemmatimonadota bacterium]